MRAWQRRQWQLEGSTKALSRFGFLDGYVLHANNGLDTSYLGRMDRLPNGVSRCTASLGSDHPSSS